MGLFPTWQQTRDGRFWYCGEPSPNQESRMERWAMRFALLVPPFFASMFILPRPWHFIGLGGWAAFTVAFIGRQLYFKWNLPWADWRVSLRVRQADGTVTQRTVRARGIDAEEACLRARYHIRQGHEEPLETEVLGPWAAAEEPAQSSR